VRDRLAAAEAAVAEHEAASADADEAADADAGDPSHGDAGEGLGREAGADGELDADGPGAPVLAE